MFLRSAVLVVVLMASATAAFAAAGLNMAWTNCVGEGTPVTLKTFACTSTAGTNQLVCSLIAPAGVDHFNGAEIYVDLITQATPLPDWWAMYTMSNGQTQCRTGLSANMTVSSSAVVCQDIWQGLAGGGMSGYALPSLALPTINPGNAAQYATIDAIAAVPPGSEQALTADTEYFLFNILINNSKSTGTGNCAGCLVPACLSFTRCQLTQPLPFDLVNISTPGVVSLVTWQGSGADCAAVPVRKATWGAIKSMYR